MVFFKLQLIMFFEGIRSERQLIETASLNLAHRWYLGYALDEALPDHSSLTRIRQRLGVEIFQRFFEQIVDLCQEAGLVWGQELYFDATKVEANAGLASLMPRFCYEATTHVADLFADEPARRAAGDADPPSHATCRPGSCRCRVESRERAMAAGAVRPWRLLEERRLDPQRPSHRGYRRTTDFRVSTTDPDATPMWDWGATRLGYHDHYVVDGGKRRIILAALVTPADVMENEPMRDLLWRVCFRRKIWPHQVTGDAKYGTTENIVAVEDAGIRAYVPLTDFEPRTALLRPRRTSPTTRSGTSTAVRRSTRCARQRRQAHGGSDRLSRRSRASATPARVKAQCTTSDRGRMVQRSLVRRLPRDGAWLPRYRALQEGACANGRSGSSRSSPKPRSGMAYDGCGCAGLMNANIQGLLIAAGQNLKRLLAATGWGRRHAPCGSLLALPGPPTRLGVGSGG